MWIGKASKLRQYLRRFGTCARIYRSVPRGVDFYQDFRTHLPWLSMDVVFDVGANDGTWARQVIGAFPRSRIYCFEPVHATFLQLEKNLGNNATGGCYELALGASAAVGRMCCDGLSTCATLVDAVEEADGQQEKLLQDVNIETIDTFCQQHALPHVTYLKIDTEGHDLEVLRGAEEMLQQQRIDLVEVEAGMNPHNQLHVPLETMKVHLEQRGYYLFGLYEQIGEWCLRQPQLRRANALFISSQAARLTAPRDEKFNSSNQCTVQPELRD